MQDIRLITILKTLSKEELKRLGKFIQSPFYNYSKPVNDLYIFLKKYHPDFDSPKLNQEYVWRKIFPKDKFQPSKFWQLTSKFTSITQQFLITIEMESQPRLKERLLIKSLVNRDKDLVKKEIREVEKKWFSSSKESRLDIEDQFMHLHNISNFNGLFDMAQVVKFEENYLESLELFYMFQKLKTAINLRSIEKYRNLSYEFYFIETIVDLIEKNKVKDFPQLKVFAKLYHLASQDNTSLYQDVKKLFIQSIDDFNQDDKKFALHQLTNFANSKVSKGNNDFIHEVFNLYKLGLEYELLVEREIISDRVFTSIASLGASLKKFDWTRNFLREYASFLPKEFKQDALILGEGYIYFFENNISKTVELLLNYPFIQSIDTLRAKGLLIRSYFNLFISDNSYFDFFNSYFLSFEKYLQRDFTESESRKLVYLNFIRILRRIANAINSNKFNLEVKEKINLELDEKPIILKQWLRQQINSL